MESAAMRPTDITLERPDALRISYDDGHSVVFPLRFLRDNCPCAGCQGETLLLGKTYRPAKLNVLTPGQYELANVSLVGNYAMQVSWKDGHDTGIYSWAYLRQLEDSLKRHPPEEQAS